MSLEIIQADARHLPLKDESVQCIVTSPPYWGLRKYQGEQESVWGGDMQCQHIWGKANLILYEDSAVRWNHTGNGTLTPKSESSQGCFCNICGAWRGAYGLEPTIELYIEHTVTILRGLRRVLRKDGVLFWNLGDSYYQGNKGNSGEIRPGDKQGTNHGSLSTRRGEDIGPNRKGKQPGLKPKDLCLIPERVALAAQADGWWVRSRILWCKPNPMPESVTDRPTDAAEHIWMFTKSERYYYDADAVREPNKPESIERMAMPWNGNTVRDDPYGREQMVSGGRRGGNAPMVNINPLGRNLRNVWTFPTQPYSGAHFATFPEEIPRRCILAATSAKGACAQCGAPWERVAEKTPATMNIRVRDAKRGVATPEEGYKATASEIANYATEEMGESRTIGWTPTCLCRGQYGKTVPCTVLDPFAGSGTTGRVAIELNRRAVLVDIAYGEGDEYRRLAEERTTEVQRNLIGIEGVSV